MIKKLSIIAFMLFLQSCNVVIIYSDKRACVHGNGDISMSGSELKDNNANQQADGKLSVPVVP